MDPLQAYGRPFPHGLFSARTDQIKTGQNFPLEHCPYRLHSLEFFTLSTINNSPEAQQATRAAGITLALRAADSVLTEPESALQSTKPTAPHQLWGGSINKARSHYTKINAVPKIALDHGGT
uniref:Uncharacterized protein n=1 Tax=Ficedula albicollis TaxID=59894 RepID=A0A803V033_FICAL